MADFAQPLVRESDCSGCGNTFADTALFRASSWSGWFCENCHPSNTEATREHLAAASGHGKAGGGAGSSSLQTAPPPTTSADVMSGMDWSE